MLQGEERAAMISDAALTTRAPVSVTASKQPSEIVPTGGYRTGGPHLSALAEVRAGLAVLGEPGSHPKGVLVTFTDAAGCDRSVLFRTTEDDWLDFVDLNFAGKQRAAVQEVVRVMQQSEPTIKQLMVYQYALVKSPYIH